MIKLILCLVCGVAIAVTALQMRQHQLELRHQATALQQKIDAQQAKLWSQQMQIAVYTAPNAIRNTIGHDIPLAPDSTLPPQVADWMTPRERR